jgi:lipopolysaccharide cholinephosphotransferase
MTAEEDSELARIHQTLIAALADVDAVCRKLGIPYWLETGTLLGAVRHGGPIPWDDDIDIAMLQADCERFVAEAPELLGPRYSVLTTSDDPYVTVDAKIYVNGTDTDSTYAALHGLHAPLHNGLFVDVFIVDPVSPRRLVRRIEAKLAWLVRTHGWAAEIAGSPALSLGPRVRWRLAASTPGWAARALHRWLRRRRLRRDGTLLAVGEFGMYAHWTHRRETLFPLGEITFAGMKAPVPGDSHQYLVDTYGPDYMTPTPVAERPRHVTGVRYD